jgi:chaperonin GroEL
MNGYNETFRLGIDKNETKQFFNAIDKFANIVGESMGAKGRNTLFLTDLMRVRVTNDGATILRGLHPQNNIEQLALELLKEVSSKVNLENGDFSSGSAYLVAQFLLEKVKFKEKDDKLIEKIIEQIKSKSIKVTQEEDLINVATVACKDEKLGKLIGELSWQLNEHSSIIIKAAIENENHYKIIEGLSTLGAFTARDFYTQRRESLKNPKIIIANEEITAFKQIQPLFNSFGDRVSGHQQYIILARAFSQEVTQIVLKMNKEYTLDVRLLILNSAAGLLTDTMINIATITGATMLGEGTAYPLTRDPSKNPLSDHKYFGTVKEFSIDMVKGDVIFMPDLVDETTQNAIMDRISELQEISNRHDITATDADRYNRLISQVNGKVAYLYIAGETPSEQEHRLFTAEDAVNACKSAKETGYIAGGAVPLRDIAYSIDNKAIAKVLLSLYKKILLNAKIEHSEDLEVKDDYGFNVVTKEFGNMIDMKVIDASKGTMEGLKASYALAKKINNSKTIVIPVNEIEKRP